MAADVASHTAQHNIRSEYKPIYDNDSHPSRNLTRERYKFFSRRQSATETIETFVTALANLSENCDLGDLRDSLVKDIMICNLATSYCHLREKLIEKNPCSIQDAFVFIQTSEFQEKANLKSHSEVVPSNKRMSSGKVKRKKIAKTGYVRKVRDKRVRCDECGGPHEKIVCPINDVDDATETLEPSNFLAMEVKIEDEQSDSVKLVIDSTKETIKTETTELAMESTDKSSDKKTYKCRYCDLEYSSRTELKAHAKSHNKPHSCKDCGKGFRYKHHLTRHIRIHTGERPHMCSECGKCFIQESALYVHLRTHSGEKPYICNYCTKSFRQKLYLVVHMRTHTKEKPHQCHFCGKCFSQKSALNVHVRCHTGETPYHCNECGRAFAYKVDFNTHLITHTGQTPHRCRDCGKSFSTKAVLKKHTRKHTGERPFSCTMCSKAFSFKHHLVRHMRLHGDGEGTKTRAHDSQFCSNAIS